MIKANLLSAFRGRTFTLADAYNVNPDKPQYSVRARIYENLGIAFERIQRGVYKAMDCVLIEGDGKDLSFLDDASIDCIITDHPWEDKTSNKGGNRNFASYETFHYTPDDFVEKARVLKPGSFLVECLPAENANNFDYLYEIKKMAQSAGFEYYAQVPWVKGTFVANTGRKAKNSEMVLIFSKGEPRALRIDAKKTKQTGQECYMKGTNGMLPCDFNVQAVARKDVYAQSQKPVALFEQILSFVTKEGELVLDQFAGSGAVGFACMNTKRRCILIEKAASCVQEIVKRMGMTKVKEAVA